MTFLILAASGVRLAALARLALLAASLARLARAALRLARLARQVDMLALTGQLARRALPDRPVLMDPSVLPARLVRLAPLALLDLLVATLARPARLVERLVNLALPA